MYRLLLSFLLPLILLGQTAAPQEPFGSIEGRVTNAQTGDAISGASLHLSPLFTRGGGRSARSRQAQAATSQADGAFRFEAVPPGTYLVTAERDDFVNSALNGPPSNISVSPGQQVTNVAVQLSPQAIVRGKIIDENGEPVPGARVDVLTTYSVGGKPQLKRKSSTSANAAGEYSLKNLPPGTYYLAAQPPADTKKGAPGEPTGTNPAPDSAATHNSPSVSSAEPSGLDLIGTFYPKVLDLESATPLEIAAGQDLRDTNIQLLRIATYHIRGKVDASLASAPSQGWTISLAPRNSLASDVLGKIVSPNPDGTFEILKVAPGSYTLMLMGTESSTGSRNGKSSSSKKFLARQDIDVAANDLNGIVLAVVSPISLTGRVVLEGTDNANLSRVRVNLTPSGSMAVGGFQSASVKADGTFAVDNLDPGEYVVRIAGNSPGTYVKSISFNRQDITASALDLLQGGSGEVDVVLRAGAGEVDGTVLSQGDQTQATAVPGQAAGNGSIVVMLVPEQLAPDGSGIFFGNTQPSGSFGIMNVAPGHYYAFALERWTSVWQNPDFLRQMEGLGTSIDLQEFAHAQIQLPITTAEQVQQMVARLGLSAQ